jgi:hypothetical protein
MLWPQYIVETRLCQPFPGSSRIQCPSAGRTLAEHNGPERPMVPCTGESPPTGLHRGKPPYGAGFD